MWANYLQPWQGIAYNTQGLETPPTSWADVYDAEFKGRVILPSLQNTEGLANLFIASHLATGKPMAEAQKDPDSGFEKLAELKPNLLTVYTQMPQAFSLLEQGEAFMISSALSSLGVAAQGTARRSTAVPKEGIFPIPRASRHEGRPDPTSPRPISTSCSARRSRRRSPRRPSRCRPTPTRRPPGMPTSRPSRLDWAFVADNRPDWVKRWDREMAHLRRPAVVAGPDGQAFLDVAGGESLR